MIDFHSHIIYGIDDGAKDKETSLRMIMNAELEGTEYICATPHFIQGSYQVSKEEYTEKLQELSEKSHISIISGMEVYIDASLPDLYREGKIWGINWGPYMLIELPMREVPRFAKDTLYELSILGVRPVIAHPERNLKLMSNPEILEEFVADGYLFQVNSGSLTGKYGQSVQKAAEKLVMKNMVHLIGSDGHDDNRRKTGVREGFRRIREMNPFLGDWIEENSPRVIDGLSLELPETLEARNRKRSILSFFRRK
ncbi:MAG: CpsB/CapC family capsule biosynthesis tyrosine phosphatase [Clostridiaceae bacterium]